MQRPITRARHAPRQRRPTVRNAHRIAPGMARAGFEGDELAGYASLAPDDADVTIPLAAPDTGEDSRRATAAWAAASMNGAAGQETGVMPTRA